MTCSYNSQLNCNPASLQGGPSLAEMCISSQFFVFMSILNDLVVYNTKISGVCDRVEPIEKPQEEYDFVVIGGGGGGSAMAGRLSENPDWKVLVLEAGPDEPAGAEIPVFNTQLPGTSVDWGYNTTNERHACLSRNGSCSVSSGKMLGGSTSHNGMVFIRGNPKDYNNWAEKGNVGWTWDEVKPFFLKLENNGEIERVGRYHHAIGGPVSVERFPYLPPFGNSILEAAAEAGYGVSQDLNGEQFTGFSRAQATVKNGVRISSAAAYLRPARNRKNLHVSLNSLATRVIIENHKAVGVEYLKNNQLKTVRVSREVVVSAGAMESPHILLLSGIGAKEHLESMGVKVVKDLPGVGENYHDHVAQNVEFTINEPDRYDNDYTIAAQYLVNQTGPLSCSGLNQVIATLKTKSASPDHPDVQLQFTGYSVVCAPGEVGVLRTSGRRTVSIRASNLRPRSRGRISLASTDPREYPIIWGNFLSDPRDIEGLIEAIELGLKMTRTKALRAHDIKLSTALEACSEHPFPSKEYWICAIRQNGRVSNRHPAGSCKMGPSDDPMAVVDPQLRVHGIKGLRVADASIMPQVTSGNTAAPTLMIAERAADFIKRDHEYN